MSEFESGIKTGAELAQELASGKQKFDFQSQDGKFQVKFDNEKVDVRVSILPVTEGEKVVLYAPRSIDMSGILGILGGKYVFKKWTGSINSTKNKINFIFKGYNPKLYVQAIYVEDYSRVILTTLIIAVITTIITVILYRRRKHQK